MKIVIIGCGWLGTQLAEVLCAAGCQVYATRRSVERLTLLPNGVTPLLLDLGHSTITPAVSNALAQAVVVCAIPPGLRSGDGRNYLQALEQLAGFMRTAGSQGVIHFSSSGIYQGLSADVDEKVMLNTELPRVATLLAGEQILSAALPLCVTLRLSGLFGPGREPGRFVAGKTLSGAGNPVNMLHAYDACRAVLQLLKQQPMRSAVYNLCSPLKVSRQQFYQRACDIANTDVSFSDEMLISHRVNPQRFIADFAFQYRFANAIDGLTYCN